MPSLFDTPSLDRALSLPLDPKLRRLLRERVAHINGLNFDIKETSFYMIVEAGGTDADIADETGFSLLTNDGRRFGEDGFNPLHEHIEDYGTWAAMAVTAGNDCLYTVFVELTANADPDLMAFCHAYLH